MENTMQKKRKSNDRQDFPSKHIMILPYYILNSSLLYYTAPSIETMRFGREIKIANQWNRIDFPETDSINMLLCACVCQSLNHVRLCNPMDCSPSGSSKGFPRQEYWSGLPSPSPNMLLVYDKGDDSSLDTNITY